MIRRFRDWLASIFAWPDFDDFDPAPTAPSLRDALLTARAFVDDEYERRGDNDEYYDLPAAQVLAKIDDAINADDARRRGQRERFALSQPGSMI